MALTSSPASDAQPPDPTSSPPPQVLSPIWSNRAADETGARERRARHQSDNYYQTQSSLFNTTPSSPAHLQSQPIQIPSNPSNPTTGQGDRKGHLFPFARTPSPTGLQQSPSKNHFTPEADNARSSLDRRRQSSFSHSNCSHFIFTMHGDQLGGRYTPTSPLSPQMASSQRPLSPQPQRSRANHSRQSSRTMQMNLPRFHPSNFQHHDSAAVISAAQSPSMAMQRATQQVPHESPRLMRERQRELLDRVRMSSKVAASPMGIKPDAPRLDPLGSPKGAVTPFALEDAPDYFNSVIAHVSPASSPGARSDGSAKERSESKAKKATNADGIR